MQTSLAKGYQTVCCSQVSIKTWYIILPKWISDHNQNSFLYFCCIWFSGIMYIWFTIASESAHKKIRIQGVVRFHGRKWTVKCREVDQKLFIHYHWRYVVNFPVKTWDFVAEIIGVAKTIFINICCETKHDNLSDALVRKIWLTFLSSVSSTISATIESVFSS